jgi:glucose-6-phosphate 1-epimerase
LFRRPIDDNQSMSRHDRRDFLKRALGAGLATLAAPAACSTKHPAPAAAPVPSSAADASASVVTLRHFSGSSARILRDGARVVSWTRATGEEMLARQFAERGASESATAAGGIGIVFPEVVGAAPLVSMGFLHAMRWDVAEEGKDPSGAAFALLRTSDSDSSRERWPHAFTATLRVTLDEALSTAFTVTNTGSEPFSFQCALHTAHLLDDLQRASLDGLAGATYRDGRGAARVRRAPRAPLRFRAGMDRLYLRDPDRVVLHDEARDRRVLIDRAGFADLVVATPGAARRGAKPSDAQPARTMLVAPAQVDPPVTLTPGQLWSGVQRLRVGET